ncbi:hypothetical protein F5X96DRAFT_659588 [Biscogniauxia mediterranea]|nr:hypothetical protein F5X96DRAFT_659588 [Biscogniauxia mediterranea]
MAILSIFLWGCSLFPLTVALQSGYTLCFETTFIVWSEGARDCPGRKFSQVEFVATIASLFRDWRVNPVTFEG